MKRVTGVMLFVALGALVVLAVLTGDSPVLSVALLAAAVLVAITMFAAVPAARTAFADRLPRTARLGRGIMDFRWTKIAALLVACVAAFGLAAAWKALLYPSGELHAELTEARASKRAGVDVQCRCGDDVAPDPAAGVLKQPLLRAPRGDRGHNDFNAR